MTPMAYELASDRYDGLGIVTSSPFQAGRPRPRCLRCHVAPTLQLFSLHPNSVDLRYLGLVSNNLGPQCYVLVERSARLELDGYDSVVWHVALEACASSTQ